jgi:transposase-like protein
LGDRALLRGRARQAEGERDTRPGLGSDERERLKALERAHWALKRANETLRKAAVFFALAELARRMK